jgi:hypothetical protein
METRPMPGRLGRRNVKLEELSGGLRGKHTGGNNSPKKIRNIIIGMVRYGLK